MCVVFFFYLFIGVMFTSVFLFVNYDINVILLKKNLELMRS